MNTKSRAGGIKGIRAYARRRGISPSYVSKMAAEGYIPIKNGRIDEEAADRALAARPGSNNPDPKRNGRIPSPASGTVARAKLRRSRAQVARLADTLADLRTGVISPALAAQAAQESQSIAVRILAPLPAAIAPQVAGRADPDVQGVLRPAIRSALEKIATEIRVRAEKGHAPQAPPLDLSRTSETRLAAIRANLQGERIELLQTMKRGELIRTDEANWRGFAEARGKRDRLLMLVESTAGHFESLSPEEVEALLRKEIAEAIGVSADTLIGTNPDIALSQ